VPQERRVLFESLGVSVVDFRCRAHVEPEGPEEPNPTHSIVLVRRGVFGRTRQRESLLADANHLLFFNAAEPYRYAHPLPGGDDCTILAVETHRALELVARYAPRDAQNPDAPFRVGHAISSLRVARLHYELLARLRQGDAALGREDVLAELADESVRAAYGADTAETSRSDSSTAAQRRRRALVEATKLAINERLESPPSLGALARVFDCSPFHLSRVFRQAAGMSLRRYVKRLRTRVAADRLARGPWDLTRLALDLGYSDHSHFTNTFRHEWGVPPSRFRGALG
jgi:AraC family transcriptional regulator